MLASVGALCFVGGWVIAFSGWGLVLLVPGFLAAGCGSWIAVGPRGLVVGPALTVLAALLALFVVNFVAGDQEDSTDAPARTPTVR